MPETPPITPARGTHESLPDERNRHVKVYINGEFFHRDEAKVSVFDSAFLVGDGIWEGIRYYGGNRGGFAFLDLHLDRLFQAAKATHINIGMTRDEVVSALRKTIEVNGMTDAESVHVRLMVSRGDKKTPSQDPRLLVGGSNVVIIAEYKKANPETTSAGVRLFTSAVRRQSPDSLDQKLNCHSKLHEVIALIQALEAGADEALMLDPTGAVATCNATNFFIVKDGEVWTSTGQYCLNGITRRMIIELCRANGVTAREKPFSLTDVYDADESFVTGTFGGLTPVIKVDGRSIGDGTEGEMTKHLRGLYRAEISEFSHG